jgi:hypothetical protein
MGAVTMFPIWSRASREQGQNELTIQLAATDG